MKIFLTIQFISLRELAFWAGYSFLYIGNSLIDILVYGVGNSMESAEYLPVAANVLACFSVAFVEAIAGVLLFVSIRKIVKSFRCREKGRMEKEVVFYLLPAVAGVLVSVLVSLLMITVTDGAPVLLYEGKIDDFFNAVPKLKALFAAKGLVYEPGGVVVHEDGSVTYIGGCSDSPERVREVNEINKAKREKEAAQRKASLERSQEAIK